MGRRSSRLHRLQYRSSTKQRELHSFRNAERLEWGLVSASSYHPGGVHILMGDAAVKFITDAVDTGNLNARPPSFDNPARITKSPFGAWGALGTKNGGESIPADLLE